MASIETLLRNTSVRIESLDRELLGTGIVVPWGERQAVVTCAHLLPRGDNPKDGIKVCFGGERRSVAELWTPGGVDDFANASPRKDIALLTLEAPIAGVEPIAWNPGYLEGGSAVWFHGWRSGQDAPETIRTSVSGWSDHFGCYTLQDAPAKGTSGGPVCVADGSTVHIVGMIVARLLDTAARGMCLRTAAISSVLPGELVMVRQTGPSDRPADLRDSLREQTGFARLFQLGRLLGHSPRTTVFQARDVQLDREVAIKVLDPKCGDTERDNFVSGVRVAANFDHPNIVRIHGAMFGEPLALYVMQYVDGLQLRTILERDEEPLDSASTIEIIRQVADALIYMHQRGFVHGNVSDGNIRIDRAHVGKIHAVISAFGVTPAPNEADPSARPGMRDDQFCLGQVALELLHVAFANRSCPQKLAEVVMRMVDLQADRRFPSIAEAMEAFEQAVHQAGLVANRREPYSANAKWAPPEPLPDDVVARATTAYERWTKLPRFFVSFYETLFDKDPTIRERFSALAREEQPEKLRYALKLVLDFPKQRPGEKWLLADIAASHSFGKRNIPPHLYPSFERALLDTASRRDQAFDERDRQAWRAVLSYAFDFMQAHYY